MWNRNLCTLIISNDSYRSISLQLNAIKNVWSKSFEESQFILSFKRIEKCRGSIQNIYNDICFIIREKSVYYH